MPPSSRLSCFSLRNLVKKRKCPAYLIPSRPFLGRCVPTFGLVRSSANLTRSNVERMQTQDGSQVDSEKLKEGVKYLMELIDLRGTGERLLSDFAGYWWILLLGLVFAMLISFGWIMLLRLATKLVVWLSIVLCVVLLLTATMRHDNTCARRAVSGEMDDLSVPSRRRMVCDMSHIFCATVSCWSRRLSCVTPCSPDRCR